MNSTAPVLVHEYDQKSVALHEYSDVLDHIEFKPDKFHSYCY